MSSHICATKHSDLGTIQGKGTKARPRTKTYIYKLTITTEPFNFEAYNERDEYHRRNEYHDRDDCEVYMFSTLLSANRAAYTYHRASISGNPWERWTSSSPNEVNWDELYYAELQAGKHRKVTIEVHEERVKSLNGPDLGAGEVDEDFDKWLASADFALPDGGSGDEMRGYGEEEQDDDEYYQYQRF